MLFKLQKPAGGGIFKGLNHQKAFTLAEVLITIVIIGIIAAITIPALASKYEKRQLYSQFMKSYNTISNALNLAKIDHGDPTTWAVQSDENTEGNTDYIKKYIIPYLKHSDTTKELTEFGVDKYKALDGQEDISALISSVASAYPLTAALAGGAYIFQADASIVIDTNGTRGPNTFGRDLIVINLTSKRYTTDYNGNSCEGKVFCPVRPAEDCVSSNGVWGDACYQKLIQDGGMKY